MFRSPSHRAAVVLRLCAGLGLFVAAFFGVRWVGSWEMERFQRNLRIEEIEREAAEIVLVAPVAPPGEAVEMLRRWRSLDGGVESLGSKLGRRGRALPGQRDRAASLLLDRVLSLLDGAAPMDLIERVALLREALHLPADDGPASLRLHAHTEATIEVGTDEVLLRGGPDATIPDLNYGATLAGLLAMVVDPVIAADYEAASRKLFERSAALRTQIEEARMTGAATAIGRAAEGAGGGLSGRHRLAFEAQRLLADGDGSFVVRADGPDSRILVVRGEVSLSVALRVFVGDPLLRGRLLSAGFTTLAVRGRDGALAVDLATGENATDLPASFLGTL
jgi:hypothetical protein